MYRHLGYNDGRAAASEDIIEFGIAKAREIANDIDNNPAFSASYKTGYENTVSAYRPKSHKKEK